MYRNPKTRLFYFQAFLLVNSKQGHSGPTEPPLKKLLLQSRPLKKVTRFFYKLLEFYQSPCCIEKTFRKITQNKQKSWKMLTSRIDDTPG